MQKDILSTNRIGNVKWNFFALFKYNKVLTTMKASPMQAGKS